MTAYPPTEPLSLAHLSELDLPPLELVDLAARAGFASVGLRTIAAAPGGIEYPLQAASERAALRQRLQATGLTVLYVEMIGLSEATRPPDYKPALETAAAIGATRLAVAGDSADFSVVADKMAALCRLARPYGISVDIEFMPFRAVRTLDDALTVVRRTGEPNAQVLVDALHMFRSGSSLESLVEADPAAIGTFQICDAPQAPPPPEQLVVEARTNRLLPGAGGLDLAALVAALPAGTPLGVEVPLGKQYPDRAPAERLKMLVDGTRQFLS